jgi:DNA-binding transcriptional MerR regulator
MSKAQEAFRTISEVADDLDVPKHVLRFWEVKFPQIRPMKRGGGRRYYRPEDMVLLRGIQHLLHAEGYTIKGVQKILREHGVEQVKIHGATSEPDPVTKGRPSKTSVAAKASTAAAPSANPGRVRGLPKSIKSAEAARLSAMQRTAIQAAIDQLVSCRALLVKTIVTTKVQPVSVAPAARSPRAARTAR